MTVKVVNGALVRTAMYFISYTHGSGDEFDDLSWFVEATSPEKAVELWLKNLVTNDHPCPDPGAVDIVLVPKTTGETRLVEWFSSEGVVAVDVDVAKLIDEVV